MTREPQDTSAEEPDGGSLHVRFRRGPGRGNRSGLLNKVPLSLYAALFAISSSVATAGASVNAATFGEDVAFLRKHTKVIVLSDAKSGARVALAPAWQGRVMTSTARAEAGLSFGWINRELIESGKKQPHINPFGGEERLWLGPEGGQFSIFFKKGDPFDFDHWAVAKELDTLPFEVVRQAQDRVSFKREFQLTNYSGTELQIAITREVRLLEASAVRDLPLPANNRLSLVAYESRNVLTNVGKAAWTKDTGALSIWILGMYNPAPGATIVVPIRPGPNAKLGTRVTSDYFGMVPSDRLVTRDDVIFLRADGQFRSKIGVNPRRSLGKLGSYDATDHVLTIVQFSQPAGVSEYVNSLWKLQGDPFSGDALNSYNDGPPAPGVRPMGPFFEIESSSPAALLAPGASILHTHRTIHLMGPEDQLDVVARTALGVSLAEINAVFHKT